MIFVRIDAAHLRVISSMVLKPLKTVVLARWFTEIAVRILQYVYFRFLSVLFATAMLRVLSLS